MRSQISHVWLLLAAILVTTVVAVDDCENMWDTTNFDKPVCEVKTYQTNPDEPTGACEFPFEHNSKTYHHCIIDTPDNPEKFPSCKTSTGTWERCQVPTDAVIFGVTTRKAGSFHVNGASIMGGTLVWITGFRFAPSAFTTSPSASTSNVVFLVNEFSSYVCEIHPDATTQSQITCYTDKMNPGSYLVKVQVKGNFIPTYQYENEQSDARITISEDSTPKINKVNPFKGPPGSFVDISGDFKTLCYMRDTEECADDSGSRISRVYMGGQQCELIDPLTSEVYQTITKRALKCKLNKPEIGYFKVNMLVTNEFGRSLTNPDIFFVSPDQHLYNFQSYAEIDSISPQVGSTVGGTHVTIIGKYLYDDKSVPANIEIAGEPCKVIEFDMSDVLQTRIVCETKPSVSASADNHGNRGVSYIRDTSLTTFNDLGTTSPLHDQVNHLQSANVDIQSTDTDCTIWLKGFLYPRVNSTYEFTLNTNGDAKLFLSTDATVANKANIADSTSPTGSVDLLADTYYYIEAVASKQSCGLKLSVDAKLLETFLTESASALVVNEVQDIEVSSTIVPEAYTISLGEPSNATEDAMGVVQSVIISGQAPFSLGLYGVSSMFINYDSEASIVQDILNDMPIFYPNLVTVSKALANDGVSIEYTLTFSADLGNLPLLSETSGFVNATISKVSDPTGSGTKSRLIIEDAPSGLFDAYSDDVEEINAAIDQSFGIRCPVSFQINNQTHSSNTFDYEGCDHGENLMEESAYCGQCANNNPVMFDNTDSGLDFNYLCFASKTQVQVSSIRVTFIDPLLKTYHNFFIPITFQEEWKYRCVDMVPYYESRYPNNRYPLSSVKVVMATIFPRSSGILTDIVSLRKTLPLGYTMEDNENFEAHMQARKLFPSLQAKSGTLNVTKSSNTSIEFQFRPTNCSTGFNAFSLVNSFSDNAPTIARATSATGPVTGTFSITFLGVTISDIAADIHENDLLSLLQTIPSFGNGKVIRSKDCAGYKWSVKWLSGGTKPDITIAGSSLSGNSPSVTVESVAKGGAHFQPIQDDLLRTYHAEPQVSVMINDIPSKCTGNCTFTWSDDVTPTVNSIDNTTLSAIVITGTGFSEQTQENIVLIGDVPCLVTAATTTQLTCSAGENSIGTYSFTVNVLGKGLAVMNSQTVAVFELTAIAVSPSTGSTGGGNVLHINGTGFGSHTMVMIDGIDCKVIVVVYAMITCIAPVNPTNSNKQVDVTVLDQGFEANLSSAYLYDFDSTPVITSIVPNVLDVTGGLIVGSGSNLPVVTSGIKLGDTEISVVSSNSTHLVVRAPPSMPGIYDLNMLVSGMGFAKVSDKVEYKLYTSSFSPKIGSIRGGTVVNVHGDGFDSADCQNNQVSFGDQYCKVLNCSLNWIQCETSSAYVVHDVTNQGEDPYNGKGYAWSKPHLVINKGDSVHWSWSPPTGITSVKYRVLQVEDALSEEPIGFDSKTPKAVGSFTHQFNQAGIYHYWSEYVESTRIINFRGVVEVLDSLDKTLKLNVKRSGISAQQCHFPFTYNGVKLFDCTNADESFSWCSPTAEYKGQKLQCDPQGSVPDSVCPGTAIDTTACGKSLPDKRYDMLFTTCSGNLPSVNSVSRENGTFDEEIIFSGSGFSSTECENEVFIGRFKCPLQSSTSSQLVCVIGPNSGLYPKNPYPITVRVANKGYALLSDNFMFNFIPKVTTMMPHVGSVAGGTKMTLEGDGFLTKSTLVMIGQVPYYDGHNARINGSHIELNTLPAEENTYTVSVTVNDVEAIYDCDCFFNVSALVTPIVTSVSPLNINDTTTVTISGEKFGSDTVMVNVKIGKDDCNVTSVNDTSITCDVDGIDSGVQNVIVNVNGVGNAKSDSPQVITGHLAVRSISPSTGSLYGGQMITLVGNGFNMNTQVTFGTTTCIVMQATSSVINCLTSDSSTARRKRTVDNVAQEVNLNNNEVTLTLSEVSFIFSSSATPSITSVTPSSGSGGTITLAGSGFGLDPVKVKVNVGSAICSVVSITDTEIICLLAIGSAGTHNVVVHHADLGDSNRDIEYTFALSISSLSHVEGSIGGGLELVISGAGFSNSSTVSVCGNPCPVIASQLDSLTCVLPPSDTKNADSICTLTVTENSVTADSSFSYQLALTPSLTSSSPLRGGTGGGTLLTIIGTGFPNDDSLVEVSIGGSPCIIASISSTQITCNTEPFPRSSQILPIEVSIVGSGLALNDGSVIFEYIDLWSSRFTWGGLPPPGQGEIAVISAGQHIYFDAANTPVLKGIIIHGGSLIFDDNQDVALNVEYVIILGGGKFQVGTEDMPFQHRAVITMFGQPKSIELPTYGAKVIALRNGTLDLHGKPVGVTWTHLGQTAVAGSNTIVLKEPVAWPVGAEIVIATSGDKHSPGESELAYIISISEDKTTFTLDKNLEFTHLSETRTVGSGSNQEDLVMRAEVGLLSRNVLFQGNQDSSWESLGASEACPDDFSPMEFATQTCFLGRYGPELGSNEFGAIIFIFAGQEQPKDRETAIARISNIELYHVGQAFKKGRYPIHFHMNGDMPSSYVKETAIHESFNRAINIHASNYLRLTRNVIYNIMGGAYFLEDGVEIGNEFIGNLAVFVRTSSSLLNEDTTPAAFWVTNPNNTYLHNAVAGSTHFGWWYRLLDHSEGPSYRPDYCPKKIPFGRHFNNSVHSTGRFGLWIFPGYYPSASGGCEDATPSPAHFDTFTSWLCNKGGENVNSNFIQFVNFRIWDMYECAIDTKLIKYNSELNPDKVWNTYYTENLGTYMGDMVLVGNSTGGPSTADAGLILGWDRGELLKNIKFYNYIDVNTPAILSTIISGTCGPHCGGWISKTEALTFDNVMYRTKHRWDSDMTIVDLDGSLTGKAGDVVIYSNDMTQGDSDCREDSAFISGAVCTNRETQIRFSFNKHQPDAAMLFNVTDQNDRSIEVPFTKLGLTHAYGFMTTLEAKHEYLGNFEGANRVTNISYDGAYYDLLPGDWIIMKHDLKYKPDQVSISYGMDPLNEESLTPLNPAVNNLGDWYWDNTTSTMSQLFINKDQTPFMDIAVHFVAQKCKFVGCKPPENPAFRALVTERPDDAKMWSDPATWGPKQFLSRRKRSAEAGIPEDGDSILIPEGTFVVVDTPLPRLKIIRIEGVLEFDNGIDHYLEADMIFINGGQMIVGWENNPILTNVEISLTGVKNDLQFMLPDGIQTIGGKGIGVYGGLDIHGKPRDVSWTKLATTVRAGNNTIELIEPVDWIAGEQIMVVTTQFVIEQTEIMTISAVSADKMVLTLTSDFVYDHIGFEETLPDGNHYEIRAGVGLLTRNVKISAKEYDTQAADLYGFRIIVSDYTTIVNEFLAYYKGFARINNCEFVRPGQYDRAAGEDSKYGILLNNLGTYNESRPTYIRSSSFHHGYGTAVGVFDSVGMIVENNVIHRTIEYAIRITGAETVIRNNLMSVTHWGSTMLPDNAPYDVVGYFGAIDTVFAKSAIIEGNMIAGVERVAINVRGDLCDGDSLPDNVKNSLKDNIIIGAGIGIAVQADFKTRLTFSLNCHRIRGNAVYKSAQAGLYFHAKTSKVILEDNLLVDNQIAIWPAIYDVNGEAGVKSHITNLENEIIIRNSIIVGRSPQHDCEKDIHPRNISDKYAKYGTFGAGSSGSGRIGISQGGFYAKTNGMPFFSWMGLMSYVQVAGRTVINNVTFAHFNSACIDKQDAVISAAKHNDDGQHPIIVSNLHLHNVANNSKVWIYRPNIGLINPSDCVDMDCDGLKKNLIEDTDGSLLGAQGVVIAQSEFEWGDNGPRGLGDFRIPKPMLSFPNGSMIQPSQLYQHPGIVRDESKCNYESAWQAYHCTNMNYKMLIIESMDADTEDRRLSPVAVLSDSGYLDLINGPQDHGWCFGYTCQKRLSTFMALVAADQSYDITFTSTPPEMLRFRIINADASFKIRLSMFYQVSQRIDLYKDMTFKAPSNAQYVDGNMQIVSPEPLNQYKPTYQNDSGVNLFIKEDMRMYFAADGASFYDLKIAPVLMVSFGLPTTTPEEFFNPATIVGNFAALLGVDASKIRRVEIVRASRRRRSASSLNFIKIIIEENASSDLNDANALEAQKKEMDQIDATISNLFITNELQERAQSLLNVSIASLAIQNPKSNETAKAVSAQANIVVDTKAGDCAAQIPCVVQPRIKIVDENGEIISNLGNENFPWVVQANLTSTSNPSATLILQTEANVVDGYATFETLGISDVTTFAITYSFKLPEGLNASRFDPKLVPTEPVSASKPLLSCKQYESDIVTDANAGFNLTVKIIDKVSKLQVENISWANYQWSAQVRLHELGYHKASGALSTSDSTVVFDPTTGLAKFSDLVITSAGMYLLTFRVYTSSGEYDFNCFSQAITVKLANIALPTYDASSPPNYVLKFEGDYNAIEPEEVKANVYNFMTGYNINVAGVNTYSGSVYITFYSDDSSSSLIDTLIAAGLTVDPNLVYSYASINNNVINCTNCVITTATTTTTTTAPISPVAVGAIVGGLVGGIVAVCLAAVILLGIKEFKKSKVKKTHISPSSSPEPAEEGKSKSRISKLLELLSGTTYEDQYRTNSRTPNLMDKDYLNRPPSPLPTLPASLPREASQYSQDFKMTSEDFTSRSMTPKPN